MKPRLESARLTDEDFDIYVRMCARERRNLGGRFKGHGFAFAYDTADRRDADLMLKLTKLVGMRPGLHLFWATYGLEYPDIEAIVTEWIG
jgi:hypothetical protein